MPVFESCRKSVDFIKVIILSILSITIVVIGYSLLSYGYFGWIDNSNQYIFDLLDANDPLIKWTGLIFSISLLCTYSLTIYSTNKVIDSFVNIFLKELTPLRKWIKNFIRTFVCFLSCLILILAGNSVQTMQNICFAIFTIPITLLFPPMFHLIKCTDNNIPAKIIDILLIFVSLNVLAICIYSSVV